MAEKLQFNPYGNLGILTNNTQGSIPTVANEYSNPIWNTPFQIPKILPNSPLMKAWGDIQEWQNLSDEEKKRRNIVADPMYDINRWEAGLSGLNTEEKQIWEQKNSNIIKGQTDAWKERLWKNQQFANRFGKDVFYSMPEDSERDKFYYDYLTSEAVRKKYRNNQNLEQLMTLTPEGKRQLLESDYLADWQLQRANKDDENKSWWDYSLKERLNAINNDIGSYGMAGIGTGSIIGAAFEGVGSIPGAVIGGLVGAGTGLIHGITNPEDSKSFNQASRVRNNEEILNKINVADNERKKKESQEDFAKTFANYVNAYQEKQISAEDVDKMFDEIALSGKKTYINELGQTEENNYIGSNYYTIFKDTDEFEHFNTLDKLKYIAQTNVLSQKYGQGSALSVLDQDMQNYVSNNQTGWQWAGNSLKNVFVGGVANLGMSAAGLGALGARLFYGDEGLNNYLQGKDASGDGTNNWLNPQYLEKVDQYNTFDKDVIDKAEQNGGVSPYNNVVTPGTEGDFWSWNTMNEALRMNKFTWSQLLQNYGLGKLVKGATRLTGGIEMAPGVLAQESTAASKFINKAGSIGVLGSSSLGIDAAYGMQTYDEVLRQNNSKLDQLIDKDTEAIVKKRLQTPEAQNEFRKFVDSENARRKAAAGENNPYIGVDEQKAWQDYIAYVTKQVRQEQEAIHAKDRHEAEIGAADAYAIDATIEGLRMTTTNAAFKSYLFDKGTLNALKSNNPYVDVTTKNGAYALSKHATRNKALKVLGTNVWGGFHSNYFDDVTVGFAEGFGIQDYNNYLLQKYNPATYGAILDDYVSPFVAAMAGANNAMLEKRSFIDGGIGAIGSVFSFMPNVGGMLSHREIMKQAAEAAEKRGDKRLGLSNWEIVSHFINNPIVQAVADAKSATRMTEAEIKRVNDILKENGHALDNMSETLAAMNNRAIAREGTSVMEAEDAKDREAFTLVQNLLSLKNSGVVQNAQAEPNKAQWSRKKKAGYAINQGLNALLGMPLFEEATSGYQTAVQQLQDASMLDQEAESEEQAQRQQRMINTFLGLDANKNTIQNMDAEEADAFARERLKKNSDNLLDMMDKTEKIQQNFEKSLTAKAHPHVAQQLMYQYALDGRWKQRLSELEQQITGIEDATPYESPRRTIAKYGSMQGYERAKKAQEKIVNAAQESYDKAQAEAKKENDPTKSIAENARQKAMRLFKEKAAKKNLQKEQAALKTIKAEESELKSALESDSPFIRADQILRLQADDRLRMLDDFYRNNYSQEQQAEIDKAKDIMMQDGTSINTAMERVRDAAILNHRIEDNMEAARRIMQNPTEARMMQQALEENRKKAIVNYFNDKVVSEALLDFQNDSESLLSQEKAAQKAQGYSTAVLNGMLRSIEKEISRTRKAEDMDDKTLSILEDGIKEVLSQRDEKLKETANLDSYIRKTKKVNHTEIVDKVAAHYDEATGDYVTTPYSEQVTTEKELSDNDRKLLYYALDYAAERGIPIEDLAEKVQSEDFDNYVQQKNHAYDLTVNPMTGEAIETNVGVVENRVNPVSPEYMSQLVSDVVNAFKTNKDAVAAVKADKPTADKPESVATPPVETKGSTRDEGERRPDDVKASKGDIFAGLTRSNSAPNSTSAGDTTGNTATPAQPASGEPVTSRNGQIMEDAATLNSNILEDIGVLLDEVDRMNMDDRTREKIKDLISANLNSRTFNNIAELQNRILDDAIITNENEAPFISMKATTLAGLNIADIKAKKTNATDNNNGNNGDNGNNAESNNDSSSLPPVPSVLETRDLDVLMNYPTWANYIKDHNVVEFLQKLSDLWNQEREAWHNDKKQGLVHQSQVVFIYDPTLAGHVEESMKKDGKYYNPELSAPIIMALEITDNNKHLVDDESQLIVIKDKTDNKEHKYQMIGAMPDNIASAKDSESMKATARMMGDIRNRINFADTDAHVLRYAPKNDSGKYNGGVIKTGIENVSSHTEEDRIPHANEKTPKKGVQQLMDENLNSDVERFVKVTEEERQAYNDAKGKGLLALRANNLYKKLRRTFIDRLIKKERKSKSADDPNNKEMNFRLQKGTSDTYPKIVLTKKIGETMDKNTGRPIVDVLRDVDAEGSNAQEVIDSNSRFKRLFNQLKNLKLPTGLFNQDGDIVNRANYNKEIAELEKSIERTLDNNLTVYDRHVKVEISDGVPKEKTVSIHVYSGDVNNSNNLLTTLITKYTGQISPAEYAIFLKDLILDKENNTRPNPEARDFERVKWQVNYEDAEIANDKSKTKEVRDKARQNLEDLYDDGIFEMQVTKLAYPSRSVIVPINLKMKSELYPERKAEPQTPTPAATEQHAAHEVEGPAGKVDSDTGMALEKKKNDILSNPKVKKTLEIVNKMITDSKDRDITPDNKYYNIAGQIWARVTSIKYAIRDSLTRFTDTGKVAPAPLIGNSFDEFGRDVINGIHDRLNLSDNKQVEKAFGGYTNSTAKNYAEALMAMKALEARLIDKRQVLIATGKTIDNPGKITSKGFLNVTVKNADGTISTKKIRVAGTIDAIAVDSDGNLHLYDFKTHRVEWPLTKDEAINQGYDIQQSEYAEFLEDEYKLKDYGIEIKTVNIIPIGARYPSTSNYIFEETTVANQLKFARIGDTVNGQPKFESLSEDIFTVEKEFELPRLSKEELTASYEKLTEEEKKALVEIIQDQSDNPTGEITTSDQVIDAKPEVTEDVESEEEEGGFRKKGKLGRRRIRSENNNSTDSETKSVGLAETLDAIVPNDERGLLEKMRELNERCGKR